ncbi:hypothetical protein [Silvanigrella sp.]|uniref:hypothetical protein n=1 Tax=Silvanigrella sp. TaxID=2024976 RepID=UPI0037CC1DC3
MRSIFAFLFKQYWSYIFICILGTCLGIYYGGFWSFLPFLFLILFFYEWNIAPRKEKTWYFFDSLPLSFSGRYLLRVIIPFLFSILIIFLLTFFKKNHTYDFINSIADAIRISSIFALSSIIAVSLSGFFGWIILLYLISYLISSFTFYEIAVTIICLSLCYYYLSSKRSSKLKTVLIPFICSFLIIGVGSVFKLKIFEFSLNIPIYSLQLNVAENLLEEKAFIGKNFVVDWSLGGNDLSNSPLKVFIPTKYDDKLLEKMETIFLKEDNCSLNCHKLADLVSNFPKNWNQDRIQQYINSNRESEQIYALEILDGAIQPLFFNRVVFLARSGNEEVSTLAISLIRKWGDINTFQIPQNSIF